MAAMLERVSDFVRDNAPRPRVLRTMLAAALLTVATYAVAAEMRGDHPDSYVVKRGDTLWDIAGRFLQRNRLINRSIFNSLKAILGNAARCELSLRGEQLGWPEQTANYICMKGNHLSLSVMIPRQVCFCNGKLLNPITKRLLKNSLGVLRRGSVPVLSLTKERTARDLILSMIFRSC